ncbi:LacI family DNA-binding transcriptional regulator [Kutzneria sp. NPDC052558]|uniref:LacI family DNA-binding transcriptional regulator n=1 Tax=Kutzneria sp. NPDC052558 TaxID=3364121 RepID=UPI0037CC072E
MPRATIRDVARAAGVSVSTVSRVFTRPELFRDETRLKVHAAAEQLNYSPNRNAASLTTGRTANIGLVVPNLANPLFPEMIKAAQHGAREHGLAALLADSDDSAADEEKLVHALAKDVDGLILFSSLLSDEQIASVDSLRPLVFVNRHVPGHRSVLVDATHAMSLLTQYLVNLGHTAATYHPGPENSRVAHERLSALRKAGSAAGIELTVMPMGPATFESGSEAADAMVRQPLPTAVLCFNDQMAMGVVARLLQLGVRIPEQTSVTGWGGTKMAAYSTPALTTLAAPLADLGSAAVAELLLAQNDDPDTDPAPVTLEATLLARATTGRARD